VDKRRYIPDREPLQLSERSWVDWVIYQFRRLSEATEALQVGQDARMTWKGAWAAGTYNVNDVVRDGSWLMIANKRTTDQPAATDPPTSADWDILCKSAEL
jgi:hypothetical protein